MLSIGPLAGPTKTLVGQATRDNDSPPSGYQLDLLCKASFSSPSDCDQLIDAILRRLDSSSANVKWKTLRVISYLCQHGNAAIKKEFQRKIDRIRACTGFTGPQHPLRGDAPNERVRSAAKDALSALFSTQEPQSNYSNNYRSSHLSGGDSFDNSSAERDGVLGTALKSVLSTAANLVTNASSATGQISSYRPSGSNYQITGMGNPAFQRSNSQPSSVLDKMKQVFDPRWKSQSISQPSQSYTGLPMGGGPVNRADFDVKPAMLEGASQRRRGQVGGTWADEDSETHLPHSDTRQGHLPERVSSYDSHHTQRADDEHGFLETRLIEDLTAPGGVTATPSREQLLTLLNSIESLDQSLIAQLLALKLEDSQNWQTQVKALSVIECLVNEDCNEIAQFFTCNPDIIVKLASSNLRAVRIKADKVYQILGLSSTASISRSQEPSSHSQAPDLLDFPTSPQVDDLLDVNVVKGSHVSKPSSAVDHLGDLLQQSNISHHASEAPFPFITDDSRHAQHDLPFVDQGYVSMSDSNIEMPTTSSLDAGFFQTSDAFHFLNGSGNDTGFRAPQAEPFRSKSVATSVNKPDHFPSQPGSAFSFVSQPVSEKPNSEKPLDPFANAIKTVRKDNTTTRDSFSFVQDIIKDSSHTR